MDIEEKLKQIKSRFEEVNAAMSDPSVFDDPDKYTELTKERSDLEELVQDYDSWKDLHDRQEGNKELIEMDEDAEITEMARDENKEIKEQLAKLEDDIKMKLVPKDPEDSKTLLLKSEPVQVETRLLFLREICLICTDVMLILKIGK